MLDIYLIWKKRRNGYLNDLDLIIISLGSNEYLFN